LVSNRITSQNVADRAGVSRTTVSLVLNNVSGVQITPETRQRVLRAAQELEYVPSAPAQALASQQSQTIGIILIRTPQQIASDAFLVQTLDGLIESVHKKGLRLLIDIVEPEHQKATYLHLVRANRIDGIILSGPRFDDEGLNTLQETGFPTVLLGQIPGSPFPFVDVDNCAAAQLAVAHLLKLGHRRIACITNAPLTYTTAVERLNGYGNALEVAGVPFDQTLVRHGDFDSESGYRAMHSLLKSGAEFTAVFIASDTLAYGAKAAIREHGLRIPQDIALVGFDDLPTSRFTDPPLTTVQLPAVSLAHQAAEILFCLLRGEEPERKQVLLDMHLVVRESCGASLAADVMWRGAARGRAS
jgi:DNA-binding LacI/PurR family transcriptional regulator